jgi:FAD/FMN-containing dehydrogenase
MNQVLEVLGRARASGLPLDAFECWTRPCLERVLEVRGFADPFPQACPFYVLLELEAPRTEAETEALNKLLESVIEDGLVLEGTLADSSEARHRFWAYRESITESLQGLGLVYKSDLALPLRGLQAFTDALFSEAPSWYPGCELYVFGHVGDGNLHVNVLNAAKLERPAFIALCEAANHKLYALVQRQKGSIAAEHGIGMLKREFLAYSRHPREIDLFRALKSCFDPKGLLNPGKII